MSTDWEKTRRLEEQTTEFGAPDDTLPMERIHPGDIQGVGPGRILHGRYRYRLERRLGSGGFGSVFQAQRLEQPQEADASAPPETVAIKVFHNPDRDSSKLLKREISSLLALKHPRIPRVYDWGIDGNLAYLVLKYFPLGSLQDHRRYLAQLEEEVAWRVLTDMLSALNAAHGASILHLDIKPANILVDEDGGFILTDFGISQGALVPWHMIDPGLGTAGYQTPEQRSLSEESIDARTDLYGLGATVWALCTGKDLTKNRELYRGGEREAIHGLPPVSDFRSGVNPDLEEIIMGLIAVRPGDRPGCAAEVLARIKGLRGAGHLATTEYGEVLGAHPVDSELPWLLEELVDPLWSSLCETPGFLKHLVRFEDGQLISRQGEESYLTYVLLHGAIRIVRDGETIAVETREGTFVGEIATLTGRQRTASIYAQGDVYACVFNASELERLVTCNPALGLRLIRSMAARLASEQLGVDDSSS